MRGTWRDRLDRMENEWHEMGVGLWRGGAMMWTQERETRLHLSLWQPTRSLLDNVGRDGKVSRHWGSGGRRLSSHPENHSA